MYMLLTSAYSQSPESIKTVKSIDFWLDSYVQRAHTHAYRYMLLIM